MFRLGSFLFAVAILAGCGATVPRHHVWRPWTRTLTDQHQIKLGTTIKTTVSGQTEPLLGNEELLAGKLKDRIDSLLTRRGFVIGDENSELRLFLTYNTERRDRLTSSSFQYSTSYSQAALTTGTGAGATSGLGVSVATAVAAIFQASQSVAGQVTEEITNYTHTLSMEILTKSGDVIWKGESTWDSYSISILHGITPALQLILSNLPSDPNVTPWVPEVKATHVINYYELECLDVWYNCPALPFRIFFEQVPYTYDRQVGDRIFKLESVDQAYALPAFVDLVQTSEYALPLGDDDWSDPLNVLLWKKTQLGGRYLLGPDRKSVNVLIKLVGKPEGYKVERCWLATDEEYRAYDSHLSEWKKTLEEFYDVFK